MGYRKQKVESALRRCISEVLTRHVSDERITGMVSITRVDISDDFRNALVYVSVLPEKHQATTIKGLRHAAGYIHNLVCKAMDLRTVPHLDFKVDNSLKKQAGVLAALRGLVHEETTGEPQGQESASQDTVSSESHQDLQE
jgi:ribosome-binding factor A